MTNVRGRTDICRVLIRARFWKSCGFLVLCAWPVYVFRVIMLPCPPNVSPSRLPSGGAECGQVSRAAPSSARYWPSRHFVPQPSQSPWNTAFLLQCRTFQAHLKFFIFFSIARQGQYSNVKHDESISNCYTVFDPLTKYWKALVQFKSISGSTFLTCSCLYCSDVHSQVLTSLCKSPFFSFLYVEGLADPGMTHFDTSFYDALFCFQSSSLTTVTLLLTQVYLIKIFLIPPQIPTRFLVPPVADLQIQVNFRTLTFFMFLFCFWSYLILQLWIANDR